MPSIISAMGWLKSSVPAASPRIALGVAHVGVDVGGQAPSGALVSRARACTSTSGSLST